MASDDDEVVGLPPLGEQVDPDLGALLYVLGRCGDPNETVRPSKRRNAARAGSERIRGRPGAALDEVDE